MTQTSLAPPLSQDDGCGQVGVRLSLTLTVVFPPPVTSNPSILGNNKCLFTAPTHCDCFLEWSLKSLFHRPLTSACPLAFSSTVTVETNSIDVRTFLYSYHIYSVCIACGTPSNMRTLSQPTIIQHSNRPAVQMAPIHKISERKTCPRGSQTAYI